MEGVFQSARLSNQKSLPLPEVLAYARVPQPSRTLRSVEPTNLEALLHFPRNKVNFVLRPDLAPEAEESMEYLIGVGLAAAVCVFATLAGFDRDRVFYPTLVPVIATYYILFAVMGSSTRALALESLVAAAFFVLAVAGFKKNLWLIVAALAGPGVFDFFHHLLIQNPGLPAWWPGFCLSFDVLAGAVLAMLLLRRAGFASKV